MTFTSSKSRPTVDRFLRSDSTIQVETVKEIAQDLRRKHRAGSVDKMTNRLEKAIRGNKLFRYCSDEGHTYYETVLARRQRLQIPKRTPKSADINAPTKVVA